MALNSLLTTILAVVLFVGVILLFWKIRLSKGKRVLIVAALLVIVLGASLLLYHLPSFETMEDAVSYGYGGDILLSAEADESAALFCQTDAHTTTLLFLAQKDGRYKLRTATAHETILRETTDRGTVEVVRVKKTDDLYLCVTGLADREYTITDNEGRMPEAVFEHVSEGKYLVYSIAAVDLTEDYTLYLGDLAVKIEATKE